MVIALDYLGFVAYALNLKEHGLDWITLIGLPRWPSGHCWSLQSIVFLWISYTKIEEHTSLLNLLLN